MLEIHSRSRTSGQSVYDSMEYGCAVAASESGEWVAIEDSDGKWRLPLIIRSVPNSSKFDAVSPYGYSGLHIGSGLTKEELQSYWSECKEILASRGIVSLFLRFPPFLSEQANRASQLEGMSLTEVAKTILVPINDEELMWSNLHRRSRTAIRSARKAQCSAEVVSATKESITETRELYEATMSRVGAADSYFFNEDYYRSLAKLGKNLKIARVTDPGGKCVAASFIMTDDNYAHYHLSGSNGQVSGANNLMLWTVMLWARERGLTGFHLGGGLSAGDSLYKFKSSFADNPVPFSLGKIIIDNDSYRDLEIERAKALGISIEELKNRNYFPTYRSNSE